MKEQVKLFSEASCVVSATGAALTNIIYCNEGTIIGCIIPQKYHFYLYSTLASLVKCKSIFLDAKIVSKTNYSSTDTFFVDEEKCLRYADYLVSMSR